MNQKSLDQMKDILDNDEKIIWEGKPTFIPFIASGLPFLGFGIIWGLFDYNLIRNIFTSSNSINYALVPFFLLHLMPLWIGILNFVRLFLVYNNTSYSITNKRVLMRSGFLGIDFKAIDHDKIVDITVDVNPIENMLGVGTIKINSGLIGNKGARVYDSLIAISRPYEIFKKLKTVSVDIKTDWNYPNSLRPNENKGYKTKYIPE